MNRADPACWMFVSRIATIVAGFSTYIGVTEGASRLVVEGRSGPVPLAILAHSCLWLAWRAYAVARALELSNAETP